MGLPCRNVRSFLRSADPLFEYFGSSAVCYVIGATVTDVVKGGGAGQKVADF